jgi:hypothetical protein
MNTEVLPESTPESTPESRPDAIERERVAALVDLVLRMNDRSDVRIGMIAAVTCRVLLGETSDD